LLIATSFGWDNDRFFSRARRATTLALAVAGMGWLIFSGMRFWEGGESRVAPLATHRPPHNFSLIGTGPLALRAHTCSPYLEGICEEIVLLGINTRPDRKVEQSDLLFSLKSTRHQLPLVSGATQLFKEHEGVAMKATARGGSAVLIDLSHHTESVQYLLPVEQEANLLEKHPYFGFLQQGKWLGADQLIATYGGDDYRELKMKQVIELGKGAPLHVAMGDSLVWEGESWRRVDQGEATHDLPLARIRAITPSGVEVEAWDATGFSTFSTLIENQPPAGLQKTDTMLLSAKMRSPSQISCVMGKRRMVLKTGDWIVRTASGWHHLKTASEIDACINQKVKGELFVLDAIEREEGKGGVVRGRLFNDTHTQSQPFSMPVSAEKKVRTTKRKARKR
jgi:hypothetical protein